MRARAAITDREQIARLREENLWLRAELGILMDEEQIADAQMMFAMSRVEARVLLLLVNSRLLTKASAMVGLAEPGFDYDANDKIIDVWICKVRAKIKRFGASIETAWGTGYYLGPASRRLIAARLGQPVTPA